MRRMTVMLWMVVAMALTGAAGCDLVKSITGEGTDSAEGDDAEQEGEATEPDEAERASTDGATSQEQSDGRPEADDGEPIDETLFLSAYYEATCVKGQIMDISRKNEILAEVYARYGFNKHSFEAAEAKLGSKESIKQALRLRMNKCTEEAAESFMDTPAADLAVESGDAEEMGVDMDRDMAAQQGDDAAEEMGADEEISDEGGGDKADDDDDGAKKRKPKSGYRAGTFTERNINQGDMSGVRLKVVLTKGGKVSGSLQGKFEGVAFNVPFSGRVSKSGEVSAQGSRGGNSVTMSGDASHSKITGSIKGQLNSKYYRYNFKAR